MAFQATVAKPNEPRVSVIADQLCRQLEPLEYGTLITYPALRDLIFEDPQGRSGRAAILQARKKLLRHHHKLLVNIRDQGYQIALPKEHVHESRRSETASRRRTRWALEITVHAEMERLTLAERQQIDEQANRLRLKLALDKNIQKARISETSPGEVIVPMGRRLAALLQQPAPE